MTSCRHDIVLHVYGFKLFLEERKNGCIELIYRSSFTFILSKSASSIGEGAFGWKGAIWAVERILANLFHMTGNIGRATLNLTYSACCS